MKKYELVYTEHYLLAADESDIKEGDWYQNNGVIFRADDKFDEGNNPNQNKKNKKIIAHLPLNNAAFLEGVDVLPPLNVVEYDDIYADATEYALKSHSPNREARRIGYIDGYNKAKEKYRFTEEDVRKAMFLYSAWITGGTPSLRVAETAEERQEQIIKSLSQPKIPVGFECETSPMDIDEIRKQGKGFLNANTNKIKTITNSEGRTQWVGKYTY